ncbi:hypothetical protein ACSBR2_006784 [Camellia fascicularis]
MLAGVLEVIQARVALEVFSEMKKAFGCVASMASWRSAIALKLRCGEFIEALPL